MKREIKFRAWDKENKKFIRSSHCIEFDGSVHMYKMGCVIPLGDKVELNQFIGLHDKNGKEIYEGDIVTWSDGEYKHYSNPRIAVVEFNPELSFYAVNVVEHSGLCKYTDRLNHGHKFGYSNFAYSNTENHLEIAGNIYENRNLLDY